MQALLTSVARIAVSRVERGTPSVRRSSIANYDVLTWCRGLALIFKSQLKCLGLKMLP